MQKKIFIFLLLNLLLSHLYAQKNDNQVNTILAKSKLAHQNKNGCLQYTFKMKGSHTIDTFFYDIKLLFSKKNQLSQKTKISLDLFAKEGGDSTQLKRSMNTKKGYLIYKDGTGYSTQSKKSFIQNAGNCYKDLPIDRKSVV